MFFDTRKVKYLSYVNFQVNSLFVVLNINTHFTNMQIFLDYELINKHLSYLLVMTLAKQKTHTFKVVFPINMCLCAVQFY